MEMKKMVYSGDGKTELLYFELVENIFYKRGILVVINCRGSHPCAYVQFPGIEQFESYDDIVLNDLDPHGGFTFLGTLDNLGLNGIWAGWDYAHTGDWEQSMPVENDIFDHGKDKKWTTEEVATEARLILEDLLDGRYTVYN